MDAHRQFTQWVLTQNVEINGVAPHKFPGKGLGIVAENDLKVRQSFIYLSPLCFGRGYSFHMYYSSNSKLQLKYLFSESELTSRPVPV